uniref:nicotinamide riboside transporter PnuC n=1 Tax=Thaumasiovibrio occultus TaxID=1891184 RepID=UPI000B350AD2|nr:nicotinamide riboside transporter PnuC [Thaumasiovibrio occultus]
MEGLLALLDINNIVFSIAGYPISLLELSGTLFYVTSVWLVAKQNMWTWPTGIISVVLFGFLFYQCQLYADMFEQSYYLGISLYGWVNWWLFNRAANSSTRNDTTDFRYSSPRKIGIQLAVIGVGTVLMSRYIADLHNLYPMVFPQPADYPVLDSLTTVMSLVAMFLLTRKRVESWYYWIVVDVIVIGLYFAKGLVFLTGQYVVLLGVAVYGLWRWHQSGAEKPLAFSR